MFQNNEQNSYFKKDIPHFPAQYLASSCDLQLVKNGIGCQFCSLNLREQLWACDMSLDQDLAPTYVIYTAMYYHALTTLG